MAGKIMVLSDGGLASLVASALAAEEAVAVGQRDRASDPPESTVALSGRCWASTAEQQARAIQSQAQALGMEVGGGSLAPVSDEADPALGEAATLELIVASYYAMRHGCGRLVWPVHFDHAESDALDRLAAACDRAVLVGRLAQLDAEGSGVPEVLIETPLVDYDDEQLAELAVDLALPLPTLWWWDASGARAQAERARWLPSLEHAGATLAGASSS